MTSITGLKDWAMRLTPGTRISGAVGLCLLSILILWAMRDLPAPLPSSNGLAVPRRRPAQPPANRFEAVLREAQQERRQAWKVADDHRDAIEAWDPGATLEGRSEGTSSDPWRSKTLAADQEGHLRRSLAVARRAAALAQTPRQHAQIAQLLAQLQHEAGDHQQELRQARRTVIFAPKDAEAWALLGRAARCNGLKQQAQEAEARLTAVDQPSAALPDMAP